MGELVLVSAAVMPESVEVIGQPYRIEVVSDPEEGLARGTDSEFGLTDNKRQVIRVRGGQSLMSMRDTLLHEVIHALFHVAGSPMAYAAEEKVVASLSGVLLDCFRRNPELVDFLVRDGQD